MSNGNAFTKRDLITVLTAVSDKQDDMESKVRNAENRAQSAEKKLEEQQLISPKTDNDYGLFGVVANLVFDTSYNYLTAELEGETVKENTIEISKRIGVLGLCTAAVVGGILLVVGDENE